ncbi:MAG: NTP transferase domain-containing protein [Candidatus Parcubacteria bacterium]|nr:NTP transferase domain-containing protein [Candidatus Parcubacteria bacterium]
MNHEKEDCFAVNYRVVILTAGKGSRLGNRTTWFNKCLLKVGDKAVISHTVDAFPAATEFIIALGYKGSIVRQYLELTYPERKFIFVEIDKYSEPGSGPGYALKKCEEYLQCPFYFVSCDAIIDWDIVRNVHVNWASYSKIDIKDTEEYCTIRNSYAHIEWIFNKSKHGTDNAFTGVAFVKEYKNFWNEFENVVPSVDEEIQVAPTILKMKDTVAIEVNWWDTGCEKGLQLARRHFRGLQNLDKEDEEIYFVDNAVVKYFHNENMVKSRVVRANYLGDTIPKLLNSTKNFYKYEYLQGKDLFVVDKQHELIEPLLCFAKENLWKNIQLSSIEKLIFKDACRDFYYKKTLSRLNKLYEKLNIVDREDIINGQSIPKVEEIFKLVDWDWLCDGFCSGFHGDWNLSNILLIEQKAHQTFKFVDWRQDFAGLIEYGDRYYDFGKMYHSFLMPHPSVKNNQFSIIACDGLVETNIEISDVFQKAKCVFEKWVVEEGYDLKKIKVLTGIILLNMAPLHENPLDKYLFYFAKQNLYNAINDR